MNAVFLTTVRIGENEVSFFPTRVYNGLEDLAETIMNSASCILPD